MPAKIPASVREQQINAKPDIEFVRWDGEYEGTRSKAICRCKIDGHEWSAKVGHLINTGSGCAKCAGNQTISAEERINQINELPNISFVSWVGEYRNKTSKAICRCAVDGHEWSASVHNLVNGCHGCPKCTPMRSWSPEERIAQINEITNISFVRWHGDYKDLSSKATYRCDIDGHEWSTNLSSLLNQGGGCPQCAGLRRWTDEERVSQINALPNISFVRWESGYRNVYSKAICSCAVDGFEWSSQVHSLLNIRTGCPKCAPCGYNPAKPATLYALRSECGTMVKIGISNDYEQRHSKLARSTPFRWDCIELLHGDGSLIADLEKELHGKTEQVQFADKFDGHTEWRKWDSRLPLWFDNYRRNIDAQ